MLERSFLLWCPCRPNIRDTCSEHPIKETKFSLDMSFNKACLICHLQYRSIGFFKVLTVYLFGIPLQLTILKTKLTSFPTSSSGASTNISSASVYSFPLELHGATSTFQIKKMNVYLLENNILKTQHSFCRIMPV